MSFNASFYLFLSQNILQSQITSWEYCIQVCLNGNINILSLMFYDCMQFTSEISSFSRKCLGYLNDRLRTKHVKLMDI